MRANVASPERQLPGVGVFLAIQGRDHEQFARTAYADRRQQTYPDHVLIIELLIGCVSTNS